MRLGGWTRIGIVISFLYAALLFLISYDLQPSRADLERQWISDASDSLATEISRIEGRDVSAYDVRRAFLDKGNADSIAWLERVEKAPSENQKPLTAKVAKLNIDYRQRIADLPNAKLIFWIKVFGWWLCGSSLLFLAGWTIRWVARGFRESAA